MSVLGMIYTSEIKNKVANLDLIMLVYYSLNGLFTYLPR